MKTQEGYYWVKDPDTDEWMIAEWDGKDWYVCGIEYGVIGDWTEIGEQIECPYIY